MKCEKFYETLQTIQIQLLSWNKRYNLSQEVLTGRYITFGCWMPHHVSGRSQVHDGKMVLQPGGYSCNIGPLVAVNGNII